MNGQLIAVEGIDAAGKTTLCRRIVEHVREQGREAVFTSAISDNCTGRCSEIGDMMRSVQSDESESLHPDTECALMIAARVQNFHQIVAPAFRRGAVVVSDRWKTSLFVYQRGPDGDRIKPELAETRLLAFGLGLDPNLEIILDLDPRNPLRAHDDSNRLERRPIEEWDEMRLKFQNAYLQSPRTIIVSANQSRDAVWHRVLPRLNRVLEGRYGGFHND